MPDPLLPPLPASMAVPTQPSALAKIPPAVAKAARADKGPFGALHTKKFGLSVGSGAILAGLCMGTIPCDGLTRFGATIGLALIVCVYNFSQGKVDAVATQAAADVSKAAAEK